MKGSFVARRSMGDMIRDRHPFLMTPDSTVADACAALYRRRIGAVLVTEPDGALVGIFTGRDAVRCLAEGRDPHVTLLRDVMTIHPIILTPEQSAQDAIHLFTHGGFRHLPICRDGRAVGIVSLFDFRSMKQAHFKERDGFLTREH